MEPCSIPASPEGAGGGVLKGMLTGLALAPLDVTWGAADAVCWDVSTIRATIGLVARMPEEITTLRRRLRTASALWMARDTDCPCTSLCRSLLIVMVKPFLALKVVLVAIHRRPWT
jgi:hypothetical protein